MNYLKNIKWLIVICLLNSWIFCYSQTRKKIASKPNILFIAVDDLNDWTGFLGGHPQTQTPNMDALARQGMIFTKAYCAAAVCNPSRTALMSGYRPSTTGIFGNQDKMRASPVLKDALMLNQWLSKHGYYTMSRGKIFHTPTVDKDKWDSWSPVEGNYGKPPAKKEGLEYSGIPSDVYDGNLNWGGTTVPKENTPDYRNALWAAEQLQNDYEEPFFMALGIFRPHLSWFVPQEYFDKFPLDKLVMPTVKEDDLSDIKGTKPSEEYRIVKKYKKEKEVVQAYLASVNYADECVGVILDALAKSKHANNTVVVLWGDHGWHLGEKLRYKKFTLWEEATRTSLIIKAPGVTPEGAKCEKPVNLIDLYPTISALAQVPLNKNNEGRNIVPLLKNPAISWPYSSLTYQDGYSLRSNRWHYIRRKNGVEELYDHESDSLEHHNLAIVDRHQNTLKKYRIALDSILTAH